MIQPISPIARRPIRSQAGGSRPGLGRGRRVGAHVREQQERE